MTKQIWNLIEFCVYRNIPAGKCEKYKGLVCSQFLHGVNIFIDSFENQEDKENLIKNALQNICE